jgi:hypothetical protein
MIRSRLRTCFLRGLAANACLALGCTSLDRFDTKGTAAYCGALVGTPPFAEGLLPSAHPPSLNLALTLDATALTSRGSESIVVGELRTDDADDGLCASQGQAFFERAPLRTIPTLDHDALSLLEFGSGRDYNFFGWVDSSCQGTTLAVVSLMRNDDVEVRVLKPAALPPPGAGPELQPGFGQFALHRQSTGCSF